ncbi:hypothetical protein [Actinokineospora iranica]|uniref:Uncharacterized protein n=1 Tax=Actinokineospora iranica TaxID=1271860 RepID=A0A1G6K4W7_9PSEU|nr:hypothetical protein [Actinokineospora iranica]SDC25997.1 hypothetical protein SAMN05216174_101716 [Actinokineospora iranica]
MTPDPAPDPTGSWVLLLTICGWLLIKTAVAFVRLYDRLDHLPPHPPERIFHVTRHPLRVTASIVGGLTALAQGLVGAGLFTPDQGNATTGLIAAVITLLATFGLVITTEPRITPTADPRDHHGRPLIPAAPGASDTASTDLPVFDVD